MINRALRLLRVYHNLKQKDLAEKLDISPSHLCEIERGEKGVSYEILEKYAGVFRIPISSITLFAEATQADDRSLLAQVPGKALRLLEWLDTLTEMEPEDARK